MNRRDRRRTSLDPAYLTRVAWHRGLRPLVAAPMLLAAWVPVVLAAPADPGSPTSTRRENSRFVSFEAMSLSSTSITLGDSVTITARVRNLGPASDDGRIVFSFPAFTDPLDVRRVVSPSGGDAPGFRLIPAGATVPAADCRPVTTPCLAAVYADDHWAMLGAERNELTATVVPREAGDFAIDVRSTLHVPGGAACGYVSGVPPQGQDGVTDAQGWAVRRFVVHVAPAPVAAQPVFVTPVWISATTVRVGQELRISTSVQNNGAASDLGRIVMSFPTLTDSSDIDRVAVEAGDDLPGARTRPIGSARQDAGCSPVTSSYVAAEYVDDNWPARGAETNAFTVTVRPPRAGTFLIDVRATMHTAGSTACDDVNAPAAAPALDEEGWPVMRFAVQVVAVPAPVFSSLGFGSGVITLGETVTLSATVTNSGDETDDGRVVFSFPAFTDPADSVRVAQVPGSLGGRVLPAGSPLEDSSCRPTRATYLAAEYTRDPWPGHGGAYATVSLVVRPRVAGTFVIYARATMHVAGSPCQFVNGIPGYVNATDQQGYGVTGLVVTVLPRIGPTIADPSFIGNVEISSDGIALGEDVIITATVTNRGALSDDGRIVVSFPTLTDVGDRQYVTSATVGDAPGFLMFPAGAALTGSDCQPLTARYLAAEYADDAWTGSASETTTFRLTVHPPRAGLFVVEVRSTMHTEGQPPCEQVNGGPPNGQAGFIDQQGWAVRRFEIMVGASTSMTWRPLLPPGESPAARAAHAAVYDADRDEMAVYGGTALTYTGDSWALPLAEGGAWVQLHPGGPVPLRRIQHSMVVLPGTSQLFIFAGLYDDILDDLWILARTPVNWWFPTTPSARPPARMGHAGIYDPVRQRMLVIGGFGRELLNDVWEYAPMANGSWRLLATGGTPMPPRSTFGAVYDSLRDRVLIFGGDGGAVRNDVWELKLGGATPVWAPLVTAGAPPAPRREMSMVYDPQWDELVIVGGFDGAQWLGDVWTLSLNGTPTWQRRFASGASPAGRSGHSAIYDRARQRLLVFGGQTGSRSYSNEVWELRLDPPVAPGAVPALGQPASGLETATLRLALVSPNPVRDELAVAFSLPTPGHGTIDVFDLRGRRVAGADLAGLAPGPHRVVLGDGRRLPAGVYLVRLTHEGRCRVAKACVIR